MKLNYKQLETDLSPDQVTETILKECDKQPSLISGAHQMLLHDGRIETFGRFAEITGDLALSVQEQIHRSRLFIQINDQLGFEGLRDGRIPHAGHMFWQDVWEEIDDEGHLPIWPEDTWLNEGISITGEQERGLVSEWWLQRWHRRAGLANAHRFNKKATKRHVLEAVNKAVPQEALQGITCRANGCAHEIMVEAPFCIKRGYRQLIGFWPEACKGAVLFGTTLACYAMDEKLKGPEGRDTQINFKGPFRYVNVFMSSRMPKNLNEALEGACIVTVETTPQAPLLRSRQSVSTEQSSKLNQ